MPTTTKKTTTGKRTASSGKKAAASSKSKSSSSASKHTAARSSAKSTPKKPFLPREGWAAVSLFLGFVAMLNVLGVDGFFIDWYAYIVGSLIGCGLEIMPYALIIAGILLIVKRRGKARLRVTCILLLPVLFGAVRHLLVTSLPFEGFAGVDLLAKTGRALESGGLISGGLAILMRAAISNVGAVILLIVLMIVCVLIACNFTLSGMKAKLTAMKPAPEPEEQPKAVEPKGADTKRKPAAEIEKTNPPHRPAGIGGLFGKKKPQGKGIDIALDPTMEKAPKPSAEDGKVSQDQPDYGRLLDGDIPMPEAMGDATGRLSQPNVPTPAQALRQMEQHSRMQDVTVDLSDRQV